MNIVFFKQDELINEKNLMSVAQGEECLAVCNQVLFNYFDQLAGNINNNIKVVITGWRRGYSAEAVADHLFINNFNGFAGKDFGVKDTDSLLQSMFTKMGYDTSETYWGVQYGYTPSLEERTRDPLDVQVTINVRAQDLAEDHGFETIVFGQYQNNTGSVRNKEEAISVDEFRHRVCTALAKRQAQFFTITAADTGNV